MSWETAVVGVTLAAMTLGWTYLLCTLWAFRKEFEIAARSPSLNIIVQITCLVLVMSVLLHWLLLSVGESLPCFIVFWVSYAVLAFSALPHQIRAARLVVAFSRQHRVKYARFVKNTTTSRLWAALTVALLVRASFFYWGKPEHSSRNARECFYLDDTVVAVVLALLLAPPGFLLALNLSKVNDAFKMREELIGTIILGSGFLAPSTVIQILVAFKILPNTREVHIIVEVLMLLFGINTGVWGLLIPLARAHRHGLLARFKGKLLPVENVGGVGAATEIEGVLALAIEGGELAGEFDTFCKKHLCQESWDFIMDATNYGSKTWNDPDEQYNRFLDILNQYLLPTSPDEVNISGASSKRMKALGSREVFSHLDDEEKCRALEEPLAQIVQMLEENLLTKFRGHVAAERDAQLARVAGGDKELVELMKASSRVRGD